MRLRFFVLSAPLVSGLLQCGPVTNPPADAPFNTCTPGASCSQYCPSGSACACEKGTPCTSATPTCEETLAGAPACLTGPGSLPQGFVLVVDAPLGTVSAPGQSIAITPEEIACAYNPADCTPTIPNLKCTAAQAAATKGTICVHILPDSGRGAGAVAQASGAYRIDDAWVHGVYGSSTPESLKRIPAPLSVPVQATLTPEWAAPCTGCAGPVPTTAPASLVGLPISTLFGQVVNVSNGGCTVRDPPGWCMLEPPGDPGYLTYEPALTALPPYNDGVPPVPASLVSGGGTTFVPSAASTYTLQIGVGGPTLVEDCAIACGVGCECVAGCPCPLAGGTIVINDPLTGLPLTSQGAIGPVTPCAGGQYGYGVTLASFASPETVLAGANLVLTPPSFDGIPRPVLSEPLEPPGLCGGTAFVGLEEVYDTVPPPVRVTGKVLAGNTPVPATLHLASLIIYSGPNCVSAVMPNNFLSYQTVVTTDARPGHTGEYSVLLPEGVYTVTIDPGYASGLARTQIFSTDLPKQRDCPRTSVTQDLSISPLVVVTGTVQIADGRPLSDAEVDFTPTLPTVSFPAAAGSSGIPANVADRPRPFVVRTDPSGGYSILVDAGTYDITVRPRDGTRLPWVVQPAVSIQPPLGQQKPKPQPPLYVPAPAPLTLTLYDPLSAQPLEQALVRAYAFSACQPPMNGSCLGTAHQIGEAVTDATGTIEMYLTPVPFHPSDLSQVGAIP